MAKGRSLSQQTKLQRVSCGRRLEVVGPSRFVAAPMSGLPGPPRYRSGALVNSELLAAIATVAFKSLSASEVLSNPFRLYVYAFDRASNRVASRAL